MIELTLVILVILVALTAWLLYKWGTKNNDYFKLRNIPYDKPTFILGNSGKFLFRRESMYDFLTRLYNAFPNRRISGIFSLRSPVYLVRDPELVKQISVKDFDSFENHNFFVPNQEGALWSQTVFMLKGQKWREMRATLSPAFTGSKMRSMFELVAECSENIIQYFMDQKSTKDIQIVSMKNLFTSYANDTIAKCSFGVQIDSLRDPRNAFRATANRIVESNASLYGYMKMLAIQLAPNVMKWFGVEFIDRFAADFFRKIVTNTMTMRSDQAIIRPDMINILMDVKRGLILKHDDNEVELDDGYSVVQESDIGRMQSRTEWTDDELIAQCMIFYIGGFDTVSSFLCTVAYALAAHPDVQLKLISEIDKTYDNLNGQRIKYDDIQRMKYMDCVVSEALRMWPPGVFIDRICTKDYTFTDGDEEVFIEKGATLWFPIYAFHHDEKYFPSPERYDPERFSDENRWKLSGSFMPFGNGPRNCIGSRFALMQTKCVFYHLLREFTLEITSETDIPLVMKTTPLGMTPYNGLPLGLRIRVNKY